MCYYNGLKVTKAEYIRLKELEQPLLPFKELADRPLQSGFAYSDWLILKPNENTFQIAKGHWEFIPYWNKDMKAVTEARKKFTTLNAIGENLLTSKMYKDAALNRRCLILSSGFYEWQHVGKLKYPYHITLPDKEYFFMAGIYQPWTDKETGETMDTFAIVTTKANPLMEQIHNSKKRMPVILNDELAYEWIQPGLSESRIKEIACHQYEAPLKAYTISKDFRAAENPTEYFEYLELPKIITPN